jgi:hypothetical protein
VTHLEWGHLFIPPTIEAFDYKWSPALKSDDLIAKKVLTVKCAHKSEKEAPFRFHVHVDADLNDPLIRYVMSDFLDSLS